MAIGRISGPLLKSNLIRDGVDLAFETDLLYLNVTGSRIGINTNAPTVDLEVDGDTKTTNLEVVNQLDIGNITVTGNIISSDLSTISFLPSGGDPTIYQAKLIVDDIQIQGNRITTEVSNSDLELEASGTGKIKLQSNTDIDGDLYVSGNINAVGNVTIGGNIVIGNELSDTITINASIQSDLIPETADTYNLGSPTFRWNNLYAEEVNTEFLNLASLNVGNLSFYDNVISTTSNNDLILDTSGTGRILLGNFAIFESTITNTVSGSITQILHTGIGYFKIEGTNGFVPPKGDNAQRPTAYAVLGMTRYNTESKALEIWDGFDWSSPAGASGAVSEIQANDIAAQIALTLG